MYFETWCQSESEKLLPGGSEENHFDVKETWYPLFYIEDLDKLKPTPFTLLEQNLVIWWDKNTQSWCVFEDKCPHRLAPLSEGRINENGEIECPYHGWTFAHEGECTSIPQQPEGGKAQNSKRACVQSLPAVVCQGLLFAYPGNPENAAKTKVPMVDALEESPSEWVCLNTFRDIPYDAFTLLENVLDSSHIPYTHHNTVGNRINVSPVELEIVISNKYGFHGIWEEGPRKGKLGKQDTTFIAPNLMWHDLTSKQFGRTLTVVYVTPIRKGECRLFARFPFKFASKLPAFFINLTPRWYSHIGQNAILEDDQIFLHYQERYLEKAGGSSNINKAFYLPTKADLFVFELHQWLNNYKVNPFPHDSLPSLGQREELLDRYHSHTKHCSSCSRALSNIKKLRLVLAVIFILLLSATPLLLISNGFIQINLAILVSILSLVSGLGWLSLGKLIGKFYNGRSIAPRNLPDK